MKNLRIAGLALMPLGATTLSATADLTATPASVIPTHFHWSVQPNDGSYKSFHFDSQHGWWNATLTKGDITVSEHGVIPTKDRLPFYQGLASYAGWELKSDAKVPANQPGYHYVITMGRDEHEAMFTGAPTTEHEKFITYVNGSLVGQEQKAMESRLGSIPSKK